MYTTEVAQRMETETQLYQCSESLRSMKLQMESWFSRKLTLDILLDCKQLFLICSLSKLANTCLYNDISVRKLLTLRFTLYDSEQEYTFVHETFNCFPMAFHWTDHFENACICACVSLGYGVVLNTLRSNVPVSSFVKFRQWSAFELGWKI